MRAIKSFDEFIEEGIAKKQSPDKSRANFLINEADTSLEGLNERIKKIGINEKNANSIIKDSYDIIMGLVRARMLLDGYNASGFGAHEAEVSYLRALGFIENDMQFANQLRFFRNGMLYYGKVMDKEYAQKVLDFLGKVYPRLKNLLKQ